MSILSSVIFLLGTGLVLQYLDKRSGKNKLDKTNISVIGLNEKQAVQFLIKKNITYRIIRRDNQDYMVTQDYLIDRINLEILDDRVINQNTG